MFSYTLELTEWEHWEVAAANKLVTAENRLQLAPLLGESNSSVVRFGYAKTQWK